MDKISFVEDSIYQGKVFHKRFIPFEHSFSYNLSYLWIDIQEKKYRFLKYNKVCLISFFDCDHGEVGRDKGESLFSYLKKELRKKKIYNAFFIKVLCLPRILNYQFNPISIFVCFSKKKEPIAIIYQVSNTFGERHAYIRKLPSEDCRSLKKFHVSPFFGVKGHYKISLEISEKIGRLMINYDAGGKKLLTASFNGNAKTINELNLFKLILVNCLQNFKVTLGIYYEALKLWFKGATYNKKPGKPENFSTKI